MKCNEIEFGTFSCAYSISFPWKCKFEWEAESERRCKHISIDTCLLPEILKLWEFGIKTTGCCCGHGDVSLAYIGVEDEYIEKMIQNGYKTYFNTCRPNDKDSFVPKTILNYK